MFRYMNDLNVYLSIDKYPVIVSPKNSICIVHIHILKTILLLDDFIEVKIILIESLKLILPSHFMRQVAEKVMEEFQIILILEISDNNSIFDNIQSVAKV